MTNSYREISNTIWNIANHLHGTFHAYEYQDVILPLTVLKRLDDALEPTKQKTLERFNELDGRVTNLSILYRTTGYNFYNTSPYTFRKLLEAPTQAAPNLRKYIDGFSDNVKEIFSKFEFDRILDKLNESELLYLSLKEFNKIDLDPNKVQNYVIGLAFEDLIRRFAEQSNETAGEHYTPRDVVRLMTSLLFTGEEKELAKPGVIKEIYDPACGTGGMLTVSKDFIQTNFNKDAKIFLYGQELNATTYAVCKADMLLKGEDIDSIKGGDKEHTKASTLSNDQHQGQRFDYVLSNPPFGVSWEKDKTAVVSEAERGFSGRFGAGLPRISDPQLLFMQHVIAKMKTKDEGGGEAAVIFNVSPLTIGDAGGGESEIRRWILENDLLDTIVAIPENLFFNTPIPTCVWIFSTRKPLNKKNKITLVDARKIRTQLRKKLGDKRFELTDENTREIVELYSQNQNTENVKIFDTTDFAYRQITIQRPLRLKFEFSPEKIKTLYSLFNIETGGENQNELVEVVQQEIQLKDTVLGKLANDNKTYKVQSIENQGLFKKLIDSFIGESYNDKKVFDSVLERRSKEITDGKLGSALYKNLIKIVGERDENAEICLDKNGNPEPDNELKDFERVPLSTDIYEYFEKEVKPYVSDAWIDEKICDKKDGQVGIVGYEIPFFKYFYKYDEIRKVEDVENSIRETEIKIQELYKEFDIYTTKVANTVAKGINPHVKLKPSGVDWLGDIPEDWDIKPLKAIFHSKKELVGSNAGKYTLLRLALKGVAPKQNGQSGKNPTNYEAYQLYKPGDLVFCTFDYDVTPRTIGLIEEEGILTGAYTRLIPSVGICSKYYYYYYLSLDTEKALLHLCTGLRNGLSKYVFWGLPNPVPPLKEQEKIVEYLDQETKKIDKIVNLIKLQTELLKEFRSSYIYSVVTGKNK